MSYVIWTHTACLDTLPIKEVYRYMGVGKPDEALAERVELLLPRFLASTECRACCMEVPVRVNTPCVDLDVLTVESAHLARNLDGCSRAVVFAATIGGAADRQRHIAAVTSPTDALILDAMGSAAIEAFCDELCDTITQRFPDTRQHPRFSPGYGDLPLALQGELLCVLDAHRKIGVTLTDSLLMLPQKSVSAIVGLEKRDGR